MIYNRFGTVFSAVAILTVTMAVVTPATDRTASKVATGDLRPPMESALPQAADTAWLRMYNGPGNTADRATAMKIDAAGNLFITGNSIASRAWPTILSYDPNGNLRWERHYFDPLDTSAVLGKLVLDNAGNVYLAGYALDTALHSLIVKYDNNGVFQWVRQFDTPDTRNSQLSAITVDRDGNVYAAGAIRTSVSIEDFLTLKYDAAGTFQWERRYDGPLGKMDAATAIAVDSLGNVYVTGGAATDSFDSGEFGYLYTPDYATVKYNPAGDSQWVRLYSGAGHMQDSPSAIQTDPSGNVIVTGMSDAGISAGYFDMATLKYDSNGNLIWERRYDGPGHQWDQAFDLQLDAAGNVYVCGTSTGAAGGAAGTGRDFATIKYSAAGVQQWAARYTGDVTAGEDNAVSLCVSKQGLVYVTGSSIGPGPGADFATIIYSANGEQLWSDRYNDPMNGGDVPCAIGIDGGNGVYVTGSTNSGPPTGWDYLTIKYEPCACTIARGDPNRDGAVNVFDVIYTVDMIFSGDPAPDPNPFCPVESLDENCDGWMDVFDIIQIVEIVFNGAIPCNPCMK